MYATFIRCAPAALCALALSAQSQAQPRPAAPQRTILDNRVTHGSSGSPDKAQALPSEGASGRTVDTLLNSTEDLNSIRDGYLRRLSGDGCPPDVAIRVADLRARLRENTPRTGPRDTGQDNAAAQEEGTADLEGSLLILAAQWYQTRPEAPSGRPVAAPNRDLERARLVDFVLSPGDNSVGAAQPGTDATQVKAELDRLLAGCRVAGR